MQNLKSLELKATYRRVIYYQVVMVVGGVSGGGYTFICVTKIFMSLFIFSNRPPPAPPTPQISDKKFMTPYSHPTYPQQLSNTHGILPILCPSNLIKTGMKHKAHLFNHSHRLMVSLFSCTFYAPVTIVGGIKICPCLSVCLSVRQFVTLYGIEFV